MRLAFSLGNIVIHLPKTSTKNLIKNPLKHFQQLPFSISSFSPTNIMAASDENYGFDRPEMYTASLNNTIDFYERHVFLCYSNALTWPSKVENDPLPKLFFSSLKARKDLLPLKTRLTICGECNETDCKDGDVLIFPEMVKYRGLKESDIDAFLDDVLVNGKPWASGVPESLVGAYVFVCAHANRDKRCGVCGPILVEKFKEEIESRNLDDQVFVNTCSHIGGHKYAGNVIIFGTSAEGKIIGDWYGYVTPADVPDLIDVHIGKGEIIEKLWRGQMGLKVEAADEVKENKLTQEIGKSKTEEKSPGSGEEVKENKMSCCQGSNGVSCCKDRSEINGENGEVVREKISEEVSIKTSAGLPGWIGKWEQSDVLVAAGVIGAVATIAVAYSIFKRSS